MGDGASLTDGTVVLLVLLSGWCLDQLSGSFSLALHQVLLGNRCCHGFLVDRYHELALRINQRLEMQQLGPT